MAKRTKRTGPADATAVDRSAASEDATDVTAAAPAPGATNAKRAAARGKAAATAPDAQPAPKPAPKPATRRRKPAAGAADPAAEVTADTAETKAPRRARRKGGPVAAGAEPEPAAGAVAEHPPAVRAADDEPEAGRAPADAPAVPDADTDAAGPVADTDRPGHPAPSDAERQTRRDARRAERQASRQAERAAAKAARQASRRAEREAARAARQAERRGPRANAAPSAHDAQVGTAAPDSAAAPRRPVDKAATPVFDVLFVAQGGGIDREAAILAASLRRNAPGFAGRLIVAEPQPGGAWDGSDPRMGDGARAALTALGAEIRPLDARDFGRGYPHGNKIEALSLLDPGRPFLFLDSDTLVLGDIGAVPFDFARPSASMRRSGTWPQPPAYGETYDSIWRSLYDRFGLDMDGSLDPAQPAEHWERFLYFNAGWFFGADPAEFGRRFRDWAVAVRDDPGEPLACQSLDPWLDQVILPLVIHSLGGGRPGADLRGMDGDVTCHWRNLPLLYARESDRAVDEMEAVAAMPEIAPLLAGWEPAERLIAWGQGRSRVRPMFWSDDPPQPEQAIRHRLRQAGFWLV